jgi:exopolyphosphatase/guanosine-5'-triphosphate,3'-diphosphate pyrophosphatase
VRHIDEEAGEFLDEIARSGFDRVIGTSGTILSLGAIATGLQGRSPGAVLRNRRVTAKQLRRVKKQLVELSLEKRMRVPGLEPRRADLSVAGAVLFDTMLRRLGADAFTLCDMSLREGLILDYVARHRKEIAQADRYPDIRRRSVVELAERCNYWPEHAAQVARLALSIFEQTRGVHGLTDREREWLEYAALLHDIGVHISYERHHKHSEYLITNGALRGFEPDEVVVIALTARYHRRAEPARRHAEFGALPRRSRRVVRRLAAILRLAESLDRSHSQAVASIEFHDRGDDGLLRIRARDEAELELWAAQRHAGPFERLIGKPLRAEVSTTYAEQPDEAARISRQALRRRGDRRIGQDDAAGAAGEVVERRGAPRVRHRMELVRPGQGRHKNRQEANRADAHDVQPASRHRLRG